MSQSVVVSAAILGADPLRLGEEIGAAERGGADVLHVDVMDGYFAPSLSFGPQVVRAAVTASSLPVEVHLQVREPERFVGPMVAAGAATVVVHTEATANLHALLLEIKDAGRSAGVALNPATPLGVLHETAHLTEVVVVMTTDPGFSRFAVGAPARIARVRALLDEAGRPATAVAADGGISEETAGAVVAAGASCLVAASAIFRHPGGAGAGIAALRRAAG